MFKNLLKLQNANLLVESDLSQVEDKIGKPINWTDYLNLLFVNYNISVERLETPHMF